MLTAITTMLYDRVKSIREVGSHMMYDFLTTCHWRFIPLVQR